MEDKKEDKKFVEREWTEEIEGHLDDDGFFITPNGSFWDPDYVYFNKEGFDKHGGRYDEKGEYVPGKGWDDNLNCYESEKEINSNDDEEDDDYENDDGKNIDPGYTEEAMMAELAQFDDDEDLFEGKDILKNDPNIEIETVVQNEYENDYYNNDINEENKNEIKEENTNVIKEENKNEIKEEKKDEIKEGNKNEIKEDKKEDIKNEPKENNKDINGNELDEKESDEYEEIEDEENGNEKKEDKKEENKETKVPVSIKL